MADEEVKPEMQDGEKPEAQKDEAPAAEAGSKDESKKGSTMDQLMPIMTMLAAQKDEGKGGFMAGSAGVWLIGLLLLLSMLNGGGLFGGGANSQGAQNERLILETSAGLASKIDNGNYQLASALNTGFFNQATQTAAGFCETNANINKVLCAVEASRVESAYNTEKIIANQNLLASQAENKALMARINELERFHDRAVLSQSISVTA
jgi:hypothetical protein